MSRRHSKPKVHYCDVESESEYEIGQISANSVGNSSLSAELFIHGKPIKFQLDTGAATSLISKNLIDNNIALSPTNTTLVMWNGTKLKPLGHCKLRVYNKKTNTEYGIRFLVVSKTLCHFLALKRVLQWASSL